MKATALLAGLFLLSASAAYAQPVSKPVWRSLPTPEDVAAAMPAPAIAAGQGGLARLTCKVATSGALADCVIAGEEPAGLGFGAAALTLIPKITMDPAWSDGRSAVGESITLPLRFAAPAPRLAEARYKGGSAGRLGGPGPYYPDRAARLGIAGTAVIECDLAPDGGLGACKALGEAPANEDFANAALVMAARGHLKAETRPGATAKERVRVKVVFGPH